LDWVALNAVGTDVADAAAVKLADAAAATLVAGVGVVTV
jgi:hypothetical protein